MTEPEIKIGSLAGRERWYQTTQHIDTLKDIAKDIVGRGLPATNFKLWYDRDHDFHHLAFDLDGSHYDIRYYKIFGVTKDRCTGFMSEKHFGRYDDHEIVWFFARGAHREWKVPAEEKNS